MSASASAPPGAMSGRPAIALPPTASHPGRSLDAPQIERRHNPSRTIRAASAAACVPTCAPVEAAVAELIAGTQRGLRAAASCSG
jgi:hypothetical protein